MNETFFIDRSLGRKKLPSILKKHGLNVEVHDDHLPQNAPDEEWLRLVAENNWIALTKDRRIQYRALEAQALMQEGVRSFFLTGKNKSAEELAGIFLKAIKRIELVLARHEGPFIVKIYSNGKLSVVFDKKAWLKNRQTEPPKKKLPE